MKKWYFFIAFIIFILVISAKVYFDTHFFKINRIEFNSDKIPENFEFKILQISDLHNKVFGENNEKLIGTVERLNPDIIVITGDLIDGSTVEFENVFTLIEKIVAMNSNVYFVSGNHEWRNNDTEEFLNALQKRKVTILNNRNIQITKKNITLNLTGVDDASTDHDDLKKAIQGINQEFYTILLSHSPGITDKYRTISADLILSGHTHGGQVRIPFIGALVAPDQGFFPKLDKGIYEIASNQYLYIDSGLGTSIIPIRFFNQSQLSLITIAN